jgi:hypothetical protein
MMLKEIVCEHVSQTDLLGDMVRFSCVCVCVYVCVCMYVGVCVRGGGGSVCTISLVVQLSNYELL